MSLFNTYLEMAQESDTKDLDLIWQAITSYSKIRKGLEVAGRPSIEALRKDFPQLLPFVASGILEYGAMNMHTRMGSPSGSNLKLTAKGAKEIKNIYGLTKES